MNLFPSTQRKRQWLLEEEKRLFEESKIQQREEDSDNGSSQVLNLKRKFLKKLSRFKKQLISFLERRSSNTWPS